MTYAERFAKCGFFLTVVLNYILHVSEVLFNKWENVSWCLKNSFAAKRIATVLGRDNQDDKTERGSSFSSPKYS